MISISVTEYLDKQLGPLYRFYRLFFNATAALTLIPVALFASSVRTDPIFAWSGYMHIIQFILAGLSAILFFLGARRYDAGQFIGLKQIREGTSVKAVTHAGKLDTSGVLAVTRHPWYLASILILWARPLDISAILINVILTCYLIAGTCLEERKLVREFGDQYRAYQKRVSMLIPFRALLSPSPKELSAKDDGH